MRGDADAHDDSERGKGLMETISITLFIPGTPASIKYDRVADVDYQSGDGISFTTRVGRIQSNLPYIIAYEKASSN